MWRRREGFIFHNKKFSNPFREGCVNSFFMHGFDLLWKISMKLIFCLFSRCFQFERLANSTPMVQAVVNNGRKILFREQIFYCFDDKCGK